MASTLYQTQIAVDGLASHKDIVIGNASNLICHPRLLMDSRYLNKNWLYKRGDGIPDELNLSSVIKCLIAVKFREMRRYAEEEKFHTFNLKHQSVLAFMNKCLENLQTMQFVAFERITKNVIFNWNHSYMDILWKQIQQFLPLLHYNIDCREKTPSGESWYDKRIAQSVRLRYQVTPRKEFSLFIYIREYINGPFDGGEEWITSFFCMEKLPWEPSDDDSDEEVIPVGPTIINTCYIPKGFFELKDKPSIVPRGNADAILLRRSGDIESNPGPTCLSKEMLEPVELTADEQIKEIQKQTAKLEKKIQEFKNMKLDKKKLKKQHAAFVQRELEKEKSKRKRYRKDQALKKIPKAAQDVFDERYAQGLLNFTNNIGNTAQVVSDKIGPAMDSMQQVLDALTGATDEIRKFFQLGEEVDFINVLIDIVTICKCVV